MTTSDDVMHDSPADGQPPESGSGLDASPEAASAGDHGEPVPARRPMISVKMLAAHPRNVRRNLDLSEEFIASIRAIGVKVALQITPDGDNYRVIDGGRRLAGALQAGVDEVPYDLIADRAGDEAGQFLDMITTNRYRNPLTVLEEADALFAAKEAGAARTRIRKATGMDSAGLNNALKAAKLSGTARAKVEELDDDGQLTLDELAVITEFDGDEDAIARLTMAAAYGTLDHEAELLRQARTEQAEHDRLCRELEAAGYTITEILPANGHHLSALSHDGEDLTPEMHATCPGRGVFFRHWDVLTPVHYCANPDMYGHVLRHREPAGQSTAGGAAGSPAPGGYSPDPAEPDPSRRLVIQGNREWKAAAEVRKRWLATNLFARRTASREMAQFVARQVLTMAEPLRSGLARAHSMASFAEITGRHNTGWLELCDTAPANRLPLVMLAPIVTAFEYAMTEGDGKNTWRTDRYSPCPRSQAASYLTFLGGLGYPLSAIEQATAKMKPYTGETPPGDPITGGLEHADTGSPEATGTEPDAEDGGEAVVPDGGPEDSGAGADLASEPDAGHSDGQPVTGGLEDAA